MKSMGNREGVPPRTWHKCHKSGREVDDGTALEAWVDRKRAKYDVANGPCRQRPEKL